MKVAHEALTPCCPLVDGGRIAILTIAERCVEPAERIAGLRLRGPVKRDHRALAQ
jgi:hypothetical protein